MKPKVARTDAFFGLHFDFHAAASTKGIGTVTTREQIAQWLDEVRPDYVQIDTKGHPGWTSFYSDYGYVAPGLEADQLKLFREETAKRGIALIAHHSGIYDDAAWEKHPEWCIMDRERKIRKSTMHPDSPYAEEKLIPQLKELAGKYGLDGVWMDGEIWALYEIYNPETLEAFYQASGFTEIAEEITSPSHVAFREFCRSRFEEYVKRVVHAVQAEYPDFVFLSNYAYSHFQPTKPLKELNGLSGDAHPMAIRIATRAFALHDGKPWDVMSYGMTGCFNSDEGGFFPSASNSFDRICRAGAMVISMGGGYQVDNLLTPQGGLRMVDLDRTKNVAAYLEKRKPWNYHSVPLQNGTVLLISNYNALRTKEDPEKWNSPSPLEEHCTDIILDGGRPCDVMFDYQVLEGKLKERKTLILPEIRYIDPQMKARILEFAKDGGNVIACGRETVKLFAQDVGVTTEEDNGFALYVSSNRMPDAMCALRTGGTVLKGEQGEQLFPCCRDVMDTTAQQVTLSLKVPYGKGSISLIGGDIFSKYCENHHFVLKKILREILDQLEPTPIAYLADGPERVDIIPAKKDNMTLINVINTTEYYYNTDECELGEIVPLYDITVAVPWNGEPKSIWLEPEHKVPEYRVENGQIMVKIDKLPIHTIIVIE